MSTILVESTTVPQPSEVKDGRWKAVLITPGKGSSGTYTEEVLREFGPVALRKGAKSFVTHNRLQNGEPDPFSMWGFLAEDSYYEDGVGLVGEIEVLPSWREKVSEVAPHTALSVYVMGDIDKQGNVTELVYEGDNGVDMVVYPGRPGSGLVEKLYESFRIATENGTAKEQSPPNDKKGTVMEKEEFETMLNAFGTSLVSALAEALKPSDDTPTDALDMAAVAEAARELPEDMRKEVYTSVEGKTQTEALAIVKSRVELVESIKKTFGEGSKPNTGRVGFVPSDGEKKFSLTKIGEKA